MTGTWTLNRNHVPVKFTGISVEFRNSSGFCNLGSRLIEYSDLLIGAISHFASDWIYLPWPKSWTFVRSQQAGGCSASRFHTKRQNMENRAWERKICNEHFRCGLKTLPLIPNPPSKFCLSGNLNYHLLFQKCWCWTKNGLKT